VALACAFVCAAPAAASVTTEPVGTVELPTHVTAPPQDTSRVFVVGQRGLVRVVVNGVVQATPFLDISDRVVAPDDDPDDARGLFSIAFAPDYAQSGRFYAYYVAESTEVEVAEFRRTANNPNVADPDSYRLVMKLPFSPDPGHYGGQLAFDAAGNLFISTGDGAQSANPNGDPQSLAKPFGKILRIRPFKSGASPYRIPAGNPFVNQPDALPEIWAYGFRNPFRFSLDRLTGDLVIADVGRATYEEVDYAPRSQGLGAGLNYGWSDCEGPCSLPDRTDPVFVTSHEDGYCSIIGGFVVRDRSLEELRGRYLYGDWCDPALRQLTLSSPAASGDASVGAVQFSRLRSFGEDACGRIYTAEGDGTIRRLVDGSTRCTSPLALPPGPVEPGRSGGERTPVAPESPELARPDRLAPRLRVRVVGGVRALCRRGARVRVRCSESCSLRLGGRLSLRGRRLRGAKGSTRAHRVKVLRLRLSRRSRSALRRALHRRRRVRARVFVRARDQAGNLSRRSILLRAAR
jgi:hypothetical protein